MQELEDSVQHVSDDLLADAVALALLLVQPRFGELDIPVTEHVPSEFIYGSQSHADLVLFQVGVHAFREPVEGMQDPFVLQSQAVGVRQAHLVNGQVHAHEA